MLIIPAIDIKNGKCVRLLKGEEGTETVFSDSPVEVAKKWEAYGARLIHVVDLDGAFSGKPVNFGIISEMVNSVSTPVQLGGGIRSIETVEKYLEAGVSRVILGTAAFQNPEFLAEACEKFPEMVAVGVDTKMGKIAVKGWKEVMDLNTSSVLEGLKTAGVSVIIHTDVDRDGTMSGVNINAAAEFIKSSPLPVVASGGISSMEDLEKLSTLKKFGLIGVILGKSIYTGEINLEEAIQRFS
ncbi:MAG TPA: 1-(5-phosphoribosyl)-5-[(5-phosphoribosylamino)methylideneamino]imidazole-4-carboxamide isomerase [Thermodesulfobacteriota bacterium]|nr:1-(5-phosphoribosyl)-5-[(5-phosphoribosylamino)methylideneamino]imidazole-4-carboxamide isomerase [Thermodesulfobacteriota bacterium]